MSLFLISQNIRKGYDTYDSAVVSAETPEEAATIHPCGEDYWGSLTWCERPGEVVVEMISPVSLVPAGVVCASFNAG